MKLLRKTHHPLQRTLLKMKGISCSSVYRRLEFMRKIFYPLWYLLLLGMWCCAEKHGEDPPVAEEYVSNPILSRGADPWMTMDGDTIRYCYAQNNAIYVKSVLRISQLESTPGFKIWEPPPNTGYSKEIWAPELHKINDTWYVYFAADDGINLNHRMHVISSEKADLNKTFNYLGQLTDASDKWAIDGTFFHQSDRMYFVWSGWEGDVNDQQHLYIAEMDSPTRISSERIQVSSPEYSWEKQGAGDGLPTINEGPQVIQRPGQVFIVYSASGSWSDHYCLGMLELKGDDPLLKSSWLKHPEPVFKGNDEVISPGHASFLKIGTKDYLVYHCNAQKGGGWENRQVHIQAFQWQNDRPVFGSPVPINSKVRISY